MPKSACRNQHAEISHVFHRVGERELSRRWIRLAAYLWPLPYTLAGIGIGLLLGGRFQRIDGVIEIHGPRISALLQRMYVPARAITCGHVVFGQTKLVLELTRAHERVHVRQYEQWGIVFVPAYLAVSIYLYLRGRNGYRENPFEVEAYAVDDPFAAEAQLSTGSSAASSSID